jgi:cytochrome c biogenesis protein CcdA
MQRPGKKLIIISLKIMESTSDEKKIEIGPEILSYLNSTRKWTTFLSVLGFIFLGLMIVAGLATSLFLTAFKTQEANLGIPETVMIIIFIVAGAIYFSRCSFSSVFQGIYAMPFRNLTGKN